MTAVQQFQPRSSQALESAQLPAHPFILQVEVRTDFPGRLAHLTPTSTVGVSGVHPSIANAASSSMRPQPVVTGPVSSALWKAPVAVPTQPKQPVLTARPITVQSSLAAVPAAVQQPKRPTASKPRVPAAGQTLLASAPAF